MDIYDRVLRYCEEEKLTVKEFEEKCSLGNGAVGKWKEGKTNPSIKTLSKIQNKTGISIGYWIGGIL